MRRKKGNAPADAWPSADIHVERIAIVGLSLAHADVSVLERLKARAGGGQHFARLAADELGASELVVLSTCNRFEVVFAREEGHLPCEQDRAAPGWFQECVDEKSKKSTKAREHEHVAAREAR